MTRSRARRSSGELDNRPDPSTMSTEIDWNFDAPNFLRVYRSGMRHPQASLSDSASSPPVGQRLCNNLKPPQTIADLDSMFEQPSGEKLALEDLWFQTHHPNHFKRDKQHKNNDLPTIPSEEEFKIPGQSKQNHGNSGGRPSREKMRESPSHSPAAEGSTDKENLDGSASKSDSHSIRRVSTRDGGGQGPRAEGKIDGGVRKRRGGSSNGDGCGDEGDDEQGSGRERQSKQRRIVGRALAPAASSSARAGATASSVVRPAPTQKDVMKKRLQEFRKQKQVTTDGTTTRRASVAKSKITAASSALPKIRRSVTSANAAKSVGTADTMSRTPETEDLVTNKALGDILMGSRAEIINNKQLDNILKNAVTGTDLKSKAPVINFAAALPGVVLGPSTTLGPVHAMQEGGGPAQAGDSSRLGPRTTKSDPATTAITSSKTVQIAVIASKPLATVKRSVGGGAGGNSVGTAQQRGRRAGDLMATTGRIGVKTGGAAIKASSTRKGLMSKGSNAIVSPRRATVGAGRLDLKRRPAAAVAAAVAELGLDSEFKARLEAHNKVVNKGKCLYEPAKSVRDYRKWEMETGKKYRELSVDERRDANREIDIMLGRAVRE